MARVRIVLVLVAAALVAVTGVILARALQGLRFEEAVRHETVAERVFDEMERALSEWITREEERAPDQYRFEYQPEGAAAGVLVRSPLSDPASLAERPFVVGWFHVDPDGSVHTPLRPRGGAAPDWDAATAARVARVESLVTEVLAGEAPPVLPTAASPSAPKSSALPAQPAGRTAKLPAPEAPPEEPARKESPAYDALQSLNRGARDRKQRSRKVIERELVEVDELRQDQLRSLGYVIAEAQRPYEAKDEATADAPSAGIASADSFADADVLAKNPVPEPEGASSSSPSAATELALRSPSTWEEGALGSEEERAAAPPPSGEGFASALDDDRVSARRGAGSSNEPARSRAKPARTDLADKRVRTLRVVVDPFVGRTAGDGTWILSRAVWVGSQGQRQGVVVDVEALSQWLRERGLGPTGLGGAELEIAAGVPELPPTRPLRYAHRFAEPFDGLGAGLGLEPLGDAPGRQFLLGLAALVALAAVVGLFAVDRMVSVTLHFAERRSNFVAAVSHELKTPLTAIRMYAEMLRDGLVSSEDQRDEYYRTLTAESERLSRLIQNVLEFSRLERDTRDLELTAGPLEPVVREALETLRPHVERAGLELALTVEPELPPVRFDRDALLQILFNLIDNAVKYGSRGQPARIEIHCARRGDGVELEVRDHGPGVPERQLRRVFEPFYRAEDELTRSAQGTGLGLALVRGLGESMGARVLGRNASDGGFAVSLRFAAGAS